MDRHLVDLHRLTDIIDQVSTFDQRIDIALKDVAGRIDQLHARWTGEASSRHRQAFAKWQHAATEMRVGLAELRRNAEIAHSNYVNAITANSRMWEQAR